MGPDKLGGYEAIMLEAMKRKKDDYPIVQQYCRFAVSHSSIPGIHASQPSSTFALEHGARTA